MMPLSESYYSHRHHHHHHQRIDNNNTNDDDDGDHHHYRLNNCRCLLTKSPSSMEPKSLQLLSSSSSSSCSLSYFRGNHRFKCATTKSTSSSSSSRCNGIDDTSSSCRITIKMNLKEFIGRKNNATIINSYDGGRKNMKFNRFYVNLFLMLYFIHVSSANKSFGEINENTFSSPSLTRTKHGSPSSSSNADVRKLVPVYEQSYSGSNTEGNEQLSLSSSSGSMKCYYYNETACNKDGIGCGDGFQICPIDGSEQRPWLCYALWNASTNVKNGTEIGTDDKLIFKGCWAGSREYCSTDKCIQQHPPVPQKQKNVTMNFCCCTEPSCNKEFIQMPILPTTPASHTDYVANTMVDDNGFGQAGYRAPNITAYVFGIIAIIFLLCVAVLVVYLFGKCPRKSPLADVPTNQPLLDGTNSNTMGYVGVPPIQLKNILAHGKFGSVWMAVDGNDKSVAVKVFPMHERDSWQIEKDVYSLPQMNHNNILKYLGAEEHCEDMKMEYWIITEYHSKGSLHDYLKSNTVNWSQLLTIIQGIGLGLSHLHAEIPRTKDQDGKPSIAHRDFKSKNVLLSNNFRACIADFGLALVFYPNSTCGDAHGQVGTRRYMPPEVLEGAINFTRESFLKIDIYSCGLVLWELLSRCSFGEFTCKEYRLPFEDEVGSNPTTEDMQEIVAQQKKRPEILESWFKHPGMAVVCNTIQDCWDQEAEARISAETICERIHSLIVNNDCGSFNHQLTANNQQMPGNNYHHSNHCQTAMAQTPPGSMSLRLLPQANSPRATVNHHNNNNNNHQAVPVRNPMANHHNNMMMNTKDSFLMTAHSNHLGNGTIPNHTATAANNIHRHNNRTAAIAPGYLFRETGT